ncbi:MAG: GntR family transcriptional regulator, partial [Pseudomonadota bacterium]|nr:GntR family transcriptional regulator [Pseudomonadota bacterium]
MSQVISRSNSEFLYQQVIQLVRDLCLQGSLLPGEKLPSLRKMADKLNISIPTVKQAYQLLEGQGL